MSGAIKREAVAVSTVKIPLSCCKESHIRDTVLLRVEL